MKFCGVVVWYNPADDVLNNINSYITEIEKLYIIDNSKDNHNNLLADYKYQNKCEYISLHKNLGLAYALNVGCKKAIKDSFDYVLTMDQDSIFVKITLFEKQRLKKYLMMFQGYRDAKANRMGKYRD